MNWSPITIRRWTASTGKTGWRWQCRTCPHIRPGPNGTGGRPRGGFHWDDRFTIARHRDHPGAWEACVQAAVHHIHDHHAPADHNQPGNQASLYEEPRTP